MDERKDTVVAADLTVSGVPAAARAPRSKMITANRDDPAGVDAMFAGRKDELEKAVAQHSSL